MAVNINIPSQVKTYANLAAFPASGSLKTIYIAEDTNKTYRWTGSVYVEISASAAMTWGQIGGTLSNQTDLQNALDAKVPTTRTLTINGVTQDLSADRTFTIATGLTVGTTPISSGTIGRVLFQGTGNVLQQSSSLFFDSVKESLGLGTSDVATPLGANRGLVINGGTADVHLRLQNNNSGTTANDGALLGYSFGEIYLYNLEVGPLIFGTSNTQRMRIQGNGNVLINTTTDAGFRLDVNGTARVQGQLTTTTANAQFGAIGASTGEFRIDGVNSAAYAFSVYSSSTLRFGVTGFGGITAPGGLIISSTSDLNTTRLRLGTSSSTAPINIQAQSGNADTIVLKASNGVDQFIIKNATGNVLINTTTDAGFRLDVNGTARVRGTGTTIGTTSFTVQDSASSDLFRVYDNGLVAIKAGVISLNGSNGSISGGFIASTGQIISGGTSITASAQMEVISTTRGFLPPRMTTTQKNAIASPATGLQVYDTTLNQMSYYNGTTWTNI